MDHAWTQVYNPTGIEAVSVLLAAAPIVVLLGLLGLLGWGAERAAGLALATALALAVGVFGMPAGAALAAAGYGAAFGLMPIGWIVLNAVFLYQLTVETGKFEVIKNAVASLSPDQRLQALMIAFCFGAFVEGVAGFGTPVAISSALMIGAGFPPRWAAGLALIANTAPVAFGALGTPITTLAKVTGLDEMSLSMMAGRQLPFFSLIVPAWIVVTMSGWRGLLGVWPAVLVCGGSFAVAQYVVSNFHGPTLVDVAGGLLSLILLAVFLKLWKPRHIWRFEHRDSPDPSSAPPGDILDRIALPSYSRKQLVSAWLPWILLSICMLIWGLPQVRKGLDQWSELKVSVPGLHERVLRDVPAVPVRGKAEEAIFKLNWLSTTGTGIFIAAILTAAWLRIGPRQFIAIYVKTIHRMRWPLATIAMMLAIAFTTRYSGMDVTLGLAFTRTGVLYPFFAAMLGWLGVALTGSDTSCNALFGSLQRFTAEKLGLNPILICTANSTGGVMGKMIDAQSIVVSAAATGQHGSEGKILRMVFWHSLALACLMGLLTLLQAYAMPWMIPEP